MNCRDARALMIAELHGEATRPERDQLRAHMAECVACRREARHMAETAERTRTALRRRAATVAPSRRAWPELQARMRHAPHSPPRRLQLRHLALRGHASMRSLATTLATVVLVSALAYLSLRPGPGSVRLVAATPSPAPKSLAAPALVATQVSAFAFEQDDLDEIKREQRRASSDLDERDATVEPLRRTLHERLDFESAPNAEAGIEAQTETECLDCAVMR